MPAYEVDEAQFEIPTGWADLSVTSVELESPEGIVRVVVQRNPAEKQDLATLARRRVVEVRRQLPSFEQLQEATITVDGREAAELTITYRHQETLMFQHSLAFIVGRRFLVFAVVAPVTLRETAERVFAHAVSTLEIRTPQDPPFESQN